VLQKVSFCLTKIVQKQIIRSDLEKKKLLSQNGIFVHIIWLW